MASFRISNPAREDLANILATSLQRWGEAGRARYAALLVAAMESISRDPPGLMTRERNELLRGIRSFHLKHVRTHQAVGAPVHVVFYRAAGSVIEIIRVLHERMEPTSHVVAKARRRGK
jgi:toxin ParE1/3/4